jgi:hypothetical protein
MHHWVVLCLLKEQCAFTFKGKHYKKKKFHCKNYTYNGRKAVKKKSFYMTDLTGNRSFCKYLFLGFQYQKAERHILKGLCHRYICNFQHKQNIS